MLIVPKLKANDKRNQHEKVASNQYSEKDPSVWALCFGRNRAKFPNPHQVAGVSLTCENKMTYQQGNTYIGNKDIGDSVIGK
jgi:hypothetical protein